MENAPRTSFRISSSRFSDFESKIAKLNKKAAKLGCPEVTYEVRGEEIVWIDANTGAQVPAPGLFDFSLNRDQGIERVARRIILVELTAMAPVKYEGWEFLGKIEKLEAGTILSSVPGKEIPETYRDVVIECEHCQKKRRRNYTYIVRHEDGRLKQVGHQCLRDFLGHKSPERIAAIAELLVEFGGIGDDDYEFDGPGIRFDRGVFIRDAIAMSVAVARAYGWRSKYSDNPTTSVVYTQLFNRKDLKKDSRIVPSNSDVDLADKIIEWLRSGLNTDGNQYLTNLVIVAASDFIASRHINLIISSYIAYDKSVGDPQKFRPSDHNIKNEHFGEIKKRAIYDLTVMEVREMRGEFGTTTLVKFLDNEGRIAVWFASGIQELEVGQALKAKATVKKHDEFRGLRQTTLTRVSVLEAS